MALNPEPHFKNTYNENPICPPLPQRCIRRLREISPTAGLEGFRGLGGLGV